MAQTVGYFEDDVIYSEGPFVVVNSGRGWRIEAELKGYHCPILPHLSIYEFLELNDLQAHKSSDKEKIEKSVDFLNANVCNGEIKLKGNHWEWY